MTETLNIILDSSEVEKLNKLKRHFMIEKRNQVIRQALSELWVKHQAEIKRLENEEKYNDWKMKKI